MRRWSLFRTASILVAVLASAPVMAQIYKCPVGGSYSLQQSPCPGLGQSGGELMVLPNGHRAPAAPAPAASRESRVLGRTPLPEPLALKAAK